MIMACKCLNLEMFGNTEAAGGTEFEAFRKNV